MSEQFEKSSALGTSMLPPTDEDGLNGNPIQGVFFDLLACLEGGDHPRLPPGFQPKPMNGFCEILEAFHAAIRLRQTGSGKVYEVGSKYAVSSSSSDSTDLGSIESRNLFDSPLPATPLSEQNDSREHTKYDIVDAHEPVPGLTPKQNVVNKPVETVETLAGQNKNPGQTHKVHDSFIDSSQQTTTAVVIEPKTNAPKDDITEQDKTVQDNFNGNIPEAEIMNYRVEVQAPQLQDFLKDLITQNQPNQTETKCLDREDIPELSPEFIDEVGPPLSLPKPSSAFLQPFPNEVREMERELYKYSEEIREIERILRENIIPAPNAQVASEELITSLAFGGNMMYDAEALGTPFQPNSPHYLSAYESCTSFVSGQNQAYVSSFVQRASDTVKRTASNYMDCLNLESAANEVDHFVNALESINPTFICGGGNEEKSEEEAQDPLSQEGSISGCGMEGVISPSIEMLAKHSQWSGVNAHSLHDHEEEDFHDAGSSQVSSITSASKQRKDRKKVGSMSPSDDEHVWTSASPSDYDDLD